LEQGVHDLRIKSIKVPKSLKNSKLSILWLQYPEVPGISRRFQTFICSSYLDSASVCTTQRLRVWTPEVPDFKRLSFNKKSKEDLNGIFLDLIFTLGNFLSNSIHSPQ
jgi:hypothetical protein